MNYVGKLINDYNDEFYVQNTIVLTEKMNEIRPVCNRNDIQFLFERGGTPEVVGHWLCIYYNHYQHSVNVYDT